MREDIEYFLAKTFVQWIAIFQHEDRDWGSVAPLMKAHLEDGAQTIPGYRPLRDMGIDDRYDTLRFLSGRIPGICGNSLRDDQQQK